MKKRIVLVSLVLIATAVVATFVYAGPHGRRHHGGDLFNPVAHLMAVREELDLSDAQVTQLKTIFRELREQNAPYREQLHGTIHAAAATLLANPNDIATAQAALDRQVAAEKALKTNILNATSKGLNVLTPEQRVKLGELVQKKMQQHMKQRRHHG
ncbi:MAG TPA: periplasmic heavy metal sensor [Thermoanaerobaculia bacterium]